MVVGREKYPCDITYKCGCSEEIKLLTTVDGYTHLPESFETQEKSEIHQKNIEDINSAIVDPENFNP